MADTSNSTSPADELAALRTQVARLQQQVERLKGQEEAAEQERERLQTVLEHMPVMIDAFDEDGNIALWNRECERVTGYSAAEVVGNPHAMELMAPDPVYREQKLREWKELKDDYRRFVWDLTARDGSIKTIAWSNISARVPIATWKTWGIGVDITEQAQQEKTIAESEERFRSVFEKIPDGLLVAEGATGHFLMANKAICSMTGYDAGEITRLSIHDIHPEESIPHIVSTFEEGAKGLLYQVADIPLKTKDGRIVRVDIRGIHIEVDGVPCVMGVFRDVTEQRRTAKALEESERHLRDVLDNMPIGVYHTDPTGRVLMANPAFVRMLGYSSFEELAKQNTEQMYLNSHYPRSLFRQQVERDGRVVNFESAWRRPDGSIVQTNENARVVRGALGDVLYYEGTIEDITERARMETALRQSENRYRTLVESAGETIAVVNATGTFLFLNSTAAERLGGKPQDYVGKTMWELFPCPIADRQMGSIRSVIETGRGINVVVPTDLWGTARWYNTTVVPLPEGDGRIHSALVIARDIHELRQAQKELEEYRTHMARTERLASLGTLSATIAHEMNQPLTVIRLNLQNCLALLEDNGSKSEMIRDLEDSLEGVSMATSIVARFRTFARQSSKRTPGRTSLQAVARKVMSLWEDAAKRRRMQIVLEGLDRMGELDVDGGDMEQVFFCLMENAVQAADGVTDRQLLIRCAAVDTCVEVRFIDDCGGIAPEHVDKIFDPFFTTKEENEGTGLGLCIVEQALSRAGGKVRVENRPGKGATFVITLPLQRDERL